MSGNAVSRLSELPLHALGRITGIKSGDPRKLIEMGLESGTWVKVIARRPGGSVVVSVKGVRLALGRDFSDAIEVDSVEKSA